MYRKMTNCTIEKVKAYYLCLSPLWQWQAVAGQSQKLRSILGGDRESVERWTDGFSLSVEVKMDSTLSSTKSVALSPNSSKTCVVSTIFNNIQQY